tara:strand:+ start:24 stop:311 length:288 start_codon:yes stop_codon:yes gene_type:complete
MFTVFLKFGENRSLAPQFMDARKAWIKKGLDDGVFMMVGSLQPNMGGAILAHGVTRDQIDARVNEDPFVIEGIVSAEIMEISPAFADPRLEFMMA